MFWKIKEEKIRFEEIDWNKSGEESWCRQRKRRFEFVRIRWNSQIAAFHSHMHRGSFGKEACGFLTLIRPDFDSWKKKLLRYASKTIIISKWVYHREAHISDKPEGLSVCAMSVAEIGGNHIMKRVLRRAAALGLCKGLALTSLAGCSGKTRLILTRQR